MLVVAPLASVAYQLFDASAPMAINSGYYNAYFLAYVISPWVAMVIFCTGVFLTYKPANNIRWIILIPTTTATVRILWLAQIHSNQQFHQVIPMYFILPAAFIAILWLFCINWLVHQKYHGEDNITATIDGLFRVNMNKDEKLKLLRQTWNEFKFFQKHGYKRPKA